jgi:hypothetical protein
MSGKARADSRMEDGCEIRQWNSCVNENAREYCRGIFSRHRVHRVLDRPLLVEVSLAEEVRRRFRWEARRELAAAIHTF